jgi:hypothetical protein
LSTPATDNQTCIEACFDNNSTYGIFEDGLCMCGYKNEDTSNPCWCALKVYVDSSNMACTTSTATTGTVIEVHADCCVHAVTVNVYVPGMAYVWELVYDKPDMVPVKVSLESPNDQIYCTIVCNCTPMFTSDDLEITCPSVTPSLSSTITITAKISAGYDTEINWSKLPADNVTATTGIRILFEVLIATIDKVYH